MSLVKCQECGQEISNQAVACPKCGHPVNVVPVVKKPNRVMAATLNVLGLTSIILGILVWLPAGAFVGASGVVGGLILRTLGEVLDRTSK